jgi:hypothetical protein
MKKVSLFTTLLFCCLFVLLSVNAGIAQKTLTTQKPATASSQPVLPSQRVTSPAAKVAPATKEKLNPALQEKLVILRAEITDLVIGTNSSGGWYWEATIKNTSNGKISGKNLTVQGMKKSFPVAQNSWTPASGSIVSLSDIGRNQTVKVRRNWTRCCKTDQLQVTLRGKNGTVLDTETLERLLHTPTLKHPVDVRVKSIEWNDSLKKWRVTLKNFSPYTVKMAVQGYLWPQGSTSAAPAGGATLMVPGNGEAAAMWLTASTAKHGDTLKVHTKFIMGSCGESNNDCGFKGSNNITVPNSRDYLP